MLQKSQEIPFEIHRTIGNLTFEAMPHFTELCAEAEGRALIIELARGSQIKQPMFSKKIGSKSPAEAIRAAENHAEKFTSNNFPVRRIKIETSLEFADLVRGNTFINNYFEWHGKIYLQEIQNPTALCERHKAHLSANTVKNEKSLRFLTLREYHSKSAFLVRIKSLTADLKSCGVQIFKQEYEYCFYDTDKSLDRGWLPE